MNGSGGKYIGAKYMGYFLSRPEGWTILSQRLTFHRQVAWSQRIRWNDLTLMVSNL